MTTAVHIINSGPQNVDVIRHDLDDKGLEISQYVESFLQPNQHCLAYVHKHLGLSIREVEPNIYKPKPKVEDNETANTASPDTPA